MFFFISTQRSTDITLRLYIFAQFLDLKKNKLFFSHKKLKFFLSRESPIYLANYLAKENNWILSVLFNKWTQERFSVKSSITCYVGEITDNDTTTKSQFLRKTNGYIWQRRYMVYNSKIGEWICHTVQMLPGVLIPSIRTVVLCVVQNVNS